MDEADVVRLYTALEDAGARVWLMGGWGVDALLSRRTRNHHDLDVLVEVSELESLRLALIGLGLLFKYAWWDEAWWVRNEQWACPLEQPTAFVYGSPDGLEVDVHTVGREPSGDLKLLWTAPYWFAQLDLGEWGGIEGRPVRCLSREGQLRAHTGYQLPPHHAQDVALLRAL